MCGSRGLSTAGAERLRGHRSPPHHAWVTTDVPAMISPAQARALGLGRAELAALVREGRWERIPGGYRTRPEGELRPADRWLGALFAVGGQAALSHTTAAKAYGWELLRPDHRIHVTVAKNRSRLQAPGAIIHRRVLPASSTRRLGELVVTSPVRTVLDLAASLPFLDAVVVADSALRHHAVQHGELMTGLLGTRQWNQHPQLRSVIVACDAKSGSPPETVARLAFSRAGLPAPVSQLKVRRENGWLIAVVDFAWEEQRLVVEIDGRDYHSAPAALFRDRHRQNELVQAGWRVLRFTAADVLQRPGWVAEQVARALAG